MSFGAGNPVLSVNDNIANDKNKSVTLYPNPTSSVVNINERKRERSSINTHTSSRVRTTGSF